MLFFKSLLICFIIFMSGAHASDIKTLSLSKEMGSCETNNLAFSAMRFYKIPLNQKYEDYDLYLRVILFFNADGTHVLRTTVQALLGCQTSSSGEQVCSFSPLDDKWTSSNYMVSDKILIKNIGEIELRDETNINRGFVLTFADNFLYPHLRGQEFIGGMISVNFNQFAVNTAKLCKN